MTRPDVVLRPWRPGDEKALVALHRQAYGRVIDEAHWRWKLKSRPCPVENVWVAELAGEIVFQYAATPVRIRVGRDVLDALHSVDTMVRPDLQRHGLIGRFAPRVYAAWKREGIAFVYGTPNGKWGSMLGKLGLARQFRLVWRVLPLRPGARLARRLGLPALARLPGTRRFLSATGPREGISVAEALPAGLLPDRFAVGTVRDPDWVRWRFLEPPLAPFRVLSASRGGEPAGHLSFRVSSDRHDVFLGEVHVARDDEAACGALLADLAERLGPDVENVYVLSVPGHPFERWLRARGFLSLRRVWWDVVLSPFRSLPALDDPELWAFGGGDTDVV